MMHMSWKWKMDLLLLLSLSVSSYHSQGYSASLGAKYQVGAVRNIQLHFLLIYGMCS